MAMDIDVPSHLREEHDKAVHNTEMTDAISIGAYSFTYQQVSVMLHTICAVVVALQRDTQNQAMRDALFDISEALLEVMGVADDMHRQFYGVQMDFAMAKLFLRGKQGTNIYIDGKRYSLLLHSRPWMFDPESHNKVASSIFMAQSTEKLFNLITGTARANGEKWKELTVNMKSFIEGNIENYLDKQPEGWKDVPSPLQEFMGKEWSEKASTAYTMFIMLSGGMGKSIGNEDSSIANDQNMPGASFSTGSKRAASPTAKEEPKKRKKQTTNTADCTNVSQRRDDAVPDESVKVEEPKHARKSLRDDKTYRADDKTNTPISTHDEIKVVPMTDVLKNLKNLSGIQIAWMIPGNGFTNHHSHGLDHPSDTLITSTSVEHDIPGKEYKFIIRMAKKVTMDPEQTKKLTEFHVTLSSTSRKKSTKSPCSSINKFDTAFQTQMKRTKGTEVHSSMLCTQSQTSKEGRQKHPRWGKILNKVALSMIWKMERNINTLEEKHGDVKFGSLDDNLEDLAAFHGVLLQLLVMHGDS
ncbi:hypothetical protein DACRYDRAFT_16630 [Dacryopinax primogenitus]|uniref:Uncharacterized protein n=1 Tax=Dacryopinax primogenitus (strain DJM 731) TaxID=1858805 RepID=M5FWB1_DACPD|nr:uncharacterized protein DACRYDRAFT_16630 [Dacryopinax primogenitus]EJU00659.1 hypothetical protein DACRYDRAFT_16630 [Dacryopinax primogenitus]